jgi:hypothetical protein
MVIFHGELLNHQMVDVLTIPNLRRVLRAALAERATTPEVWPFLFSLYQTQRIRTYSVMVWVKWVFKSSYTFIIHSLDTYSFSLFMFWVFFFVESVDLHDQHDQLSAGGGVPGMPWYRNSFRRSHRGWRVVGLAKMVMSGQLWRFMLIYVDLPTQWWCKTVRKL